MTRRRGAAAGSPTVLTVLYAPRTPYWPPPSPRSSLRALAPQIVSRHASDRFLGYLDGQRQRMVGEGKQNRVPNRPDLIDRYGFD